MMQRDNVIRAVRDRNFKTIHCAALDDPRLSWRAKGVLTWLITRPEGWKFRRDVLDRISNEGHDAVTTALTLLKDTGYLQVTRERGADNQFTWGWTVYESPIGGFPIDGFPIDGFSIDGKATDINSSEDASTRSASTASSIEVTIEDKQKASASQSSTALSDADVALTGGKARSKKTLSPERLADIQMVFRHWQVTLGYESRKLTPERHTKINARLDDGYTVDDLQQVHVYAKTDPFLQGENDRHTKFDDIINLYRNSGRIDRYLTAHRNIRNSPKLVAGTDGGPGRRF